MKLHTKDNIYRSNNSLVTAMKPEVKCRLRATATFLFYILTSCVFQ